MLVDFFFPQKIFCSMIFDFHFCEIPHFREFQALKLVKIKIILSKLEKKSLFTGSVPDCLLTPGTESLTRHIDLLDAVTDTHLQLVNLAVRQTSFTFSSSHLQNFHLFFTDASISDTSAFSPFASTIRKDEIYVRVVGSLSGQVFQAAVINL